MTEISNPQQISPLIASASLPARGSSLEVPEQQRSLTPAVRANIAGELSDPRRSAPGVTIRGTRINYFEVDNYLVGIQRQREGSGFAISYSKKDDLKTLVRFRIGEGGEINPFAVVFRGSDMSAITVSAMDRAFVDFLLTESRNSVSAKA